MADQVGPAPGLMFLALGLVAVGVAVIWREVARPRGPRDPGRAEPGAGA